MKNIIIAVLVIALAGLGYVVVSRNDNSSTNSSNTSSTSENSNPSTENTKTSGKTLSLAGKGLSSVPQSTFNDDSIIVLDVSNNNLTGALPAEIRKLKNLEVLDASDNNMTGIPAEIGQLSKLKTANFANNNITGLPMEIGNLKNLVTFDLRGNPNVSQQDLNQIKAKIPNAKFLTD